MALLFAGLPRWAAGSGEIRSSKHLIPKDKRLPANWSERLWDSGSRAWAGNELHTVGMPVGGIGAGQIYLCGDGSLGLWEIFNEHHVPPHGLQSYVRRTIPKPVEHGLAVYWEDENGQQVRRLDQSGFPDVTFKNEHPIGVVRYAGAGPLEIELEGFSPFIPLNAEDSGLPVTLMVVTIKNTGNQDIAVGTASWIENIIGRKAVAAGYGGARSNTVKAGDGVGRISLSAEGRNVPVAASGREPVVFADFEGKDFGDWKAEGRAFSDAPTTGTLPHQQEVSGFEGKGFAGSFHGGDDASGKLISPSFDISRRYINFQIGGGNNASKTGMRLIIDGQTVRTAAGRNSEELSWQSWEVSPYVGKIAHLEIHDNTTGGWGHTQVDHIEFSDDRRTGDGPDRFEDFPDSGTMAWAVAEPLMAASEANGVFAELGVSDFELSTEPNLDSYDAAESKVSGIVTKTVTIPAGQSHTFTHVLTWHFPNTVGPSREAGHYYAARFSDADAVLDYVFENRERLIAETRKWRDTYYDSTLPPWLLERVHMTSCCLATGTTMWWESGRFWAWEGVTCCAGTCTHVYNYVQTVARLFPELERNLREQQDLMPGVGLEPSGLVGFRHDGAYAADGQCGTVLKVYREHQMSADSEFLKRNWAATKKVLDYAIGQDGNADGILEGSQHNTYDVNFFGPNTFVGGLYLAALRAGEAMAIEMGEADYAKKLRAIFERGKEFSEEKLWNGEWFFQVVDLKEHPEHQYGPGCLSDQVFGQNWAHQLGLGYVYDPQKVRRALQSVWDYNWAPDLGPYNEAYPAQRVFAEAAEAGLFNCTWPESVHLDNGVLYRDEVWSGVEYQVASHMVYEGMIDEALSICRAVHERYVPARRNPFNEIECSDFYSRAMASWGMLLALSGVQYHGPKGELAFAPVVQQENFRAVFNGAEGWGTFEQKLGDGGAGKWELSVKHGVLRLNRLSVSGGVRGGATAANGAVLVVIDEKAVGEARISEVDGKIAVQFPDGITIESGQVLTISKAG